MVGYMPKYAIIMALILATFGYVGRRINQAPYLASTIESSQSKYEQSQYCLSGYRSQFNIDQHNPSYLELCGDGTSFNGNIDDPELYVLSGTHYLAGSSPVSINWELQPLTKYLFGISMRFFGNPMIIQYVMGVITLVLLYLLSKRLMSPLLSLIPPLLLLVDPVFIDQLNAPYLDLSVVMWLLIYLLFLSRAKYHLDWWWGGVALGALALSKSFSLGIIVAGLGFVAMYHTYLRFYIKSILIAILIYCLGYVMFFVRGGSIADFVTLHLDILRFYKSYVPEYPKGEILRLIFTGQWRTWWGDKGLVASPLYSLLWPLSTITALFALTQKWLRQKLSLHLLWIFISLVFISLRLLFPRYLLPVLPSMYLVLVYCVLQIGKKIWH